MTAHATTAHTRPRHRALLPALWAGLALTIAATAYPLGDRATSHVLADHVRASYPAYDAGEIDAAVTAYLAILSTVGVLGVLGWLGTMWALRGRGSWVRWAAAGAWLAAACFALAALTVKDTSGDVGLAPPLAWSQVLPCAPGLVAVWLLWRPRR
ncbi:hypothetical protein ACQEU6_12475 [Spirillospora sp. CA-108201]